MNQYNPILRHRRSICLKGYMYAQAGLYFKTISCQDFASLFFEITKPNPPDQPNILAIADGIMKLNDVRKMVEHRYLELENQYPKNVAIQRISDAVHKRRKTVRQ